MTAEAGAPLATKDSVKLGEVEVVLDSQESIDTETRKSALFIEPFYHTRRKPMSESMAELQARYIRTAEQYPATLGVAVGTPKEERDRIMNECLEIHTLILEKHLEGQWLTWFGVKL